MTLRALHTAATGGRALMNTIDTIANNLANVNTTAFKRQRVNFADLFYQTIQRAGFGTVGVNQHPTGIAFGTGVRLVSTERLFSQGNLERTDRELDVAIDGDGFFKVILPDGREAFTRAGNFHLDAEGNLVTAQGYRLVPNIRVPEEITKINIDQTGLVQGINPAEPNTPQQLGQFELVRFANPAGLEAIGDNLYIETAASGSRLEGFPGTTPGFGLLRQGFLEESNVDVIKELVDLINAQRAFETNTTTIRAADDILQAINALRR